MTQNPLHSLLATSPMLAAWTVSELELFEMHLRILICVCSLIVGIPAAIITLWRGVKWLRALVQKHLNKTRKNE